MTEQGYVIAEDGKPYRFRSDGQEWFVSYHPAHLPAPEGTRHGSAAVCFTPDGEVVLVTEDGIAWVLPGGRPEGDETWRETLDREVREEACAVVRDATLLAYARGECIEGHEQGLVLVRALWRADVTLLPWEPRYEIKDRLLLSPERALAALTSFEDSVLEFLAPQPLFPRLFRDALSAGCRLPGTERVSW